uniref:Uncharacterized protein n=1 Tax=Calcidiscus leptoporus TaxID=127549 RepID=A0A6U5DP40_9EUKA|mmetsp:Transcript_15252/g.35077  ORF Transcript_15252/g.35077 Transcript_15252/m.35077 type:complete len:104 (+) Transcript_15252:102-413(+)
MITFGTSIQNGAAKAKGKVLKNIRSWVEQALPPEHQETTVMVNELQCFEPGCAPVETVVTLLDPSKPLAFKIFKPAAEVEPEEVRTQLTLRLMGHEQLHKPAQ